MKVVTRVVAGAFALAQVSCASSPDSIEARYVSPNTYGNWSCPQLFDEKARISSEVTRVSDLQRENANTDTAMVAIGAIVFWPALIALAATKDRKEELGQLKGQHDALEQNITVKQCNAPPPMMQATAPAPDAAAAAPALAVVPVDPAAPASAPATPAATATPAAAAAPAASAGDPDEAVVCQTGDLAMSRTRGDCLAAGGREI
ncbi:type IV secretory pathway VirB10-like protein [Constrictibacter sp. MBR-5]|jgi:type IV secretory pathway VirB10-like protein|uniref:hypothetical protein n=1 Tax=Constrictibacter sp. MBR-5 TaxID=3156467 RepID=UPI003395B237